MVLILSRVFCKKFHFIWDLMGSFFLGGEISFVYSFIFVSWGNFLDLKKTSFGVGLQLWSTFAISRTEPVEIVLLSEDRSQKVLQGEVFQGWNNSTRAKHHWYNTKFAGGMTLRCLLIEKHSTLSGWCLIQVIEINELSGWDCRVSDSNEWQMILKIINWHMPSQGSHGIVKMFFPLQQWAFAASSRWNVKSMRKLLRTSNAHWLVMTSPTYPWLSGWMNVFILCGWNIIVLVVLLMEDILHQLGCKIHCK